MIRFPNLLEIQFRSEDTCTSAQLLCTTASGFIKFNTSVIAEKSWNNSFNAAMCIDLLSSGSLFMSGRINLHRAFFNWMVVNTDLLVIDDGAVIADPIGNVGDSIFFEFQDSEKLNKLFQMIGMENKV